MKEMNEKTKVMMLLKEVSRVGKLQAGLKILGEHTIAGNVPDWISVARALEESLEERNRTSLRAGNQPRLVNSVETVPSAEDHESI